MKKILLSFSLLVSGFTMSAQTTVFAENFDAFASLEAAGWTNTNQSVPVGLATWAQGGGTAFSTGGYNGGATSFTLCNFNSTTGAGTISNWLVTPVINVENGDVVTFYSRAGGTGTGTIYPDRLEFRMSTAGAASVVPSAGASDVGSFTTLALTINENLTTTGYPFTWTPYSYTVSGLSAPTDVRFAFRYFVTSGGPSGDNSSIIGVDALSVVRSVAGVSDFFKNNVKMYPNPAKDVLNLSVENGTGLTKVEVSDLNGRVVLSKKVDGLDVQIPTSDLASGAYMISVETEKGKGTSKFVKN